MSYVAAVTHAALIANPGSIRQVYANIVANFTADLGPGFAGLDPRLKQAAACAILAFDLKPYGNDPARVSLPAILAAPTLACDDYVRLSCYFDELLMPNGGLKKRLLGWEGGAVGNHAQLMVGASEWLLLDPTVGLVVRGLTLDDLCRGKAPAAIADFWHFQASARSNIASFHSEVLNAIAAGHYKHTDELYTCVSHRALDALGAESTWPTPAGCKYQVA